MNMLEGLRLEIPMAGDHVELIIDTDRAAPVVVTLDATEAMTLSLKLSAASHMLEPSRAPDRPFELPAATPDPISAPEAPPRQLDISRAKELVPCPHCGRRYVAGTGLGGHIRRAHRGWDDKAAEQPAGDLIRQAPTTPTPAPASNGHSQDPRIGKLVQELAYPTERVTYDLPPNDPEPATARPAFHRLVDERNTPAGVCFACECGWISPACDMRADARAALGAHVDEMIDA